MAKKKTYYRKKAVLKAISRYTRRKINYITTITFGQNQMLIDGKAQLQLQDILSAGGSEYLTLGRQYALMKLRGIRIECFRSALGEGNASFILGILQANDNDSFDAVRCQPNVLMLDRNNQTKIYVKINGTYNATNATDDVGNIKLVPQYTGLVSSGLYVFQIKITLYITFKSAI